MASRLEIMGHAHDCCALLLIDCQWGFKDGDDWGASRNHPALEHNLLQ